MNGRSSVEVVFFAALEKATPAERTAYLDETCLGNDGLRRRVEAMLAAHMQVGQFLERPVVEAAGVAALDGVEHAAADLSFLAPSSEAGSLGRLDHYEVLEVVGRGGMGVVLRARDTKLLRVVALKVLAAPLAASGAARQRFVREARATAAVRNDHIVAIHAVCEDGPVPYLVMEFIDGCSLEARIRRGGPLEVKEVVRIGIQLASGLAAAHKQGLIHRDIKPANILLENGVQRVKLTDFGLARAADDASLTQSGLIAGTPLYMAPEQAAGEAIDARSDLFSLGSVLYELCTGRPAFRAANTVAVIRRVCDDTPRPIREVNPDIPEALCQVIEHLHAKKPADRPASAQDVAELLTELLAALQHPQLVGHVPNVLANRARWKRAPRRMLYAAAALVLLVVSLGMSEATGVTDVSGTVIRLFSPEGTLVVEVDDPNVSVTVEGGDVVITGAGAKEIRLKPGQYKVEASKDGKLLRQELVTVARNGRQVVRISKEPELVADLGEGSFLLPRQELTHWMAQTADGKLLAVPCGKTVALYDTQTGTLVRVLIGHTDRCYRPAFSPDGKRLACGAISSTICIWDVETGQQSLTLNGQSGNVLSVSFDPAGRRLASACWNGTVDIWDAAKGELLHTLAAHSAPAHDVTFSLDGECLISVGWDKLGKVWESKTGQLLHTLEGHVDKVFSVAYHRGGSVLATGSESQVILWDAATYQPLHTLPTAGAGLLAFTPDGQVLVTAGHDFTQAASRSFSRWHVKSGARLATVPLSGTGGCLVGRLSTDGRTLWLISCDPPDSRVGIYDAETGQRRFARTPK